MREMTVSPSTMVQFGVVLCRQAWKVGGQAGRQSLSVESHYQGHGGFGRESLSVESHYQGHGGFAGYQGHRGFGSESLSVKSHYHSPPTTLDVY